MKIRNSASSSSSTSSNSSSSSSSSSPATDDLKSNTNLVSNNNLNGGSVGGALTTEVTSGRRKKSPKKPAQKCQQVIDTAENGGGDIYCQIIDNMPDFYYENIDNNTTTEKSSNSEGGGEEHNLEVFDSENAEKYEEIGHKSAIEQEYEDINGSEERLTSCSDEEEDDEVVIDDYSCFDTAYLKNVLNSTKRNDPIEILPTNKSQKSKDQLPPLPRMSQHQSSLVFSTSADATIASSLMTSHSNNNNIITTVDFDRNLNIRRSKRFVRQPVQPVLTQEISLNNNSSTSPTTTMTTNQMTKELGISSNQSPCLHKAISTPSILDKLKLTDNGGLKLLAQEDDATDKDTQPLVLVEDKLNNQPQQNGLSLISSASLNTADLGKSSSLNEKKQQSNNGNFFLFEEIRNFRKYNFNNKKC